MLSAAVASFRSYTRVYAVLILGMPLFACNQSAEKLATIQSKIESLDARVTELDAKIETIRELAEESNTEQLAEIQASLNELKETQGDLLDEASFEHLEHFDSREFDLEALRAIELPGKSDRAALEQYIREIMRTSSNQNSFSPTDPQVSMLKRVGEENIDLLIDAAASGRITDLYAVQAAAQLATEDSKALVLDALPVVQDLVEVVVREGWEGDAKETLVKELSHSRYLPELWVQAVAGFRDAETYDALLGYLIRGQGRLATYDAIRDLPGIELEDAVEKAWARASRQNIWERKQMAIVAVEFGIQDALEALIKNPGAPSDYYYGRARQAVKKYSPAGGSNQNMRDWYKSNKDKLYFDESERMFKVRD